MNATESENIDFLLDRLSAFASSMGVESNKILKAMNDYADTIKKAIEQLKAEKRRIEDHLAAQERLLEEVRPTSSIKYPRTEDSVSIQATPFTDKQMVEAIRNAMDLFGFNEFGRNEIAANVAKMHPGMFGEGKKSQQLFSNTFWRVVRDYKKQNKLIESEKGGGRKQTLFKKTQP